MNDKYIKTDVEGLVKDPRSGAVLNVDNKRLAAYKKQKAFMQNSVQSTERLDKVENDLAEIKDLLKQLLSKA